MDCAQWIQVKCKRNNLNDLDYEDLKMKNQTLYCKLCIQETLPFSKKTVNPNVINSEYSIIDSNLKNLLCHLNDLSEKEINNNENLTNSKCRDITYLCNHDANLK